MFIISTASVVCVGINYGRQDGDLEQRITTMRFSCLDTMTFCLDFYVIVIYIYSIPDFSTAYSDYCLLHRFLDNCPVLGSTARDYRQSFMASPKNRDPHAMPATEYHGGVFKIEASSLSPISRNTPFLPLPAELRAMIYEMLGEAKELKILQASKDTYREAAYHIYNKVPYPIDVGYGPIAAPISVESAKLIQCVQIHAHLDRTKGGIWPGDSDLVGISPFRGSETLRKSCEVTVDYGRANFWPSRCGTHVLFKAIGTLTGFKKLTVRIVYPDQCQLCNTHPRTCIMHWTLFALVRWKLDRTLGPAVLHSDQRDFRLEYHPNEFRLAT